MADNKKKENMSNIRTEKLSVSGVSKNSYNKFIIMINGLGFKRNIMTEVSSGEKSSRNIIKRTFSKNNEFVKFSYLPDKNRIYGILKTSIPKWKIMSFLKNENNSEEIKKHS